MSRVVVEDVDSESSDAGSNESGLNDADMSDVPPLIPVSDVPPLVPIDMSDVPPLVPIASSEPHTVVNTNDPALTEALGSVMPHFAAFAESGLATQAMQELAQAGVLEHFIGNEMDVTITNQAIQALIEQHPNGPLAAMLNALASTVDSATANTVSDAVNAVIQRQNTAPDEVSDHDDHDDHAASAEEDSQLERALEQLDEVIEQLEQATASHHDDNPMVPISSLHFTLPVPSNVHFPEQQQAQAQSDDDDGNESQSAGDTNVHEALQRYWTLFRNHDGTLTSMAPCTHGLDENETYDDPFSVPLTVCQSCEEVVLVPRNTNEYAVRTLHNPKSLRSDGRFQELFDLHAEHLQLSEMVTQLVEQQRSIRLRLFEWQERYSAEPIDYMAQNSSLYRELQRSVSKTNDLLEATRKMTTKMATLHRRRFVSAVYRTYPHAKTDFISAMRYEILKAHPIPLYMPDVVDVPKCTACDKVANVRLHPQSVRYEQVYTRRREIRTCQCRHFVMCLDCLLEWYWNSSEQLSKRFAACPTCQAELRLNDIVPVRYSAANDEPSTPS